MCGCSLTSTEYDVILTSEVIEDLSQLPVASVYVGEVNECDDNCDVNNVDIDDDDDEVSRRVHTMDDIVSSDYLNDDDVLRPVHTVDDGELSASDVKDVCEVRCEVVGDDKVDDNLGRVYTAD